MAPAGYADVISALCCSVVFRVLQGQIIRRNIIRLFHPFALVFAQAFSATEVLESAVAIATKKEGEMHLPILAPQQLVSCAPNPRDVRGFTFSSVHS